MFREIQDPVIPIRVPWSGVVLEQGHVELLPKHHWTYNPK